MARPTVAEIEATVASGVTTLRCPACRREEPIGDPIRRGAEGWPTCCEDEMRLCVPTPTRAAVDPMDGR